jgi:hypothetical protein
MNTAAVETFHTAVSSNVEHGQSLGALGTANRA